MLELLEARQVALALHDPYYMPKREDVTADFVYIRWLGRRADEEAWWAERVERFLEAGLSVYGYFNNHWAGHSPASVQGFLERLGRPVEPIETVPHQPRLF